MNFDQIFMTVLFVIFLGALIAGEFFFKNNEKYKKALNLTLKICACVMFGFFSLRTIMNDSFVWIINMDKISHPYPLTPFPTHDYLQSFLRWGYLVAILLITTAAFYNSKTLRRFAVVISVVSIVLSIVYYNDYMKYFTSYDPLNNRVRGILTPNGFRHFEFDVEIILMSACSLILIFQEKTRLLMKKPMDFVKFFVFLPFLFIVAIPVYVPQSLVGYTSLQMTLFSPQHFIWLGGTVVLGLAIFFVFRDQSMVVKKAVVCYLCLFLFQHYNSVFMWIIEAKRLPFQLCNFGCYFALIAFAFNRFPKMQKFFNFVFVINISGALFAAIGFDLGDGLLCLTNVHYYLEHIYLFIIPYLMIAFGIYQLPGKNAFIHATIGFTAFFIVCVVAGLYFNIVMLDKPLANGKVFWTRCNYFYIFDEGDATKILPFLKFVRKWPVTANNYTFHPLLMFAVYIGFLPFSFIVYVINKKIIMVGRDHSQLRERRHLLKQKEEDEIC